MRREPVRNGAVHITAPKTARAQCSLLAARLTVLLVALLAAILTAPLTAPRHSCSAIVLPFPFHPEQLMAEQQMAVILSRKLAAIAKISGSDWTPPP